MRVAIPHTLDRAEVRHRLESRKDDISGFVPGGLADVETSWQGEDRMVLVIRAMGQELTGHVDVEDDQVVFDIVLPPALSFVEPMVKGALEDKGRKLLA